VSGCALDSADLKEELMVESTEINNAWASITTSISTLSDLRLIILRATL